MATHDRNVTPTVVYGPMACGKTRNKERLRELTGCDDIFDDWYGQRPLPRSNTLVLTNLSLVEIERKARKHDAAIRFVTVPFESFEGQL